MYADKLTEAIKEALDETDRRRAVQLAYNEEHGITPETIIKGVSDIAGLLQLESPTVPSSRRRRGGTKVEGMSRDELEKLVITLEEEMYLAAEELRFEYAAKLRDEVKDLRRDLQASSPPPRRLRLSCRVTLRACSARSSAPSSSPSSQELWPFLRSGAGPDARVADHRDRSRRQRHRLGIVIAIGGMTQHPGRGSRASSLPSGSS